MELDFVNYGPSSFDEYESYHSSNDYGLSKDEYPDDD